MFDYSLSHVSDRELLRGLAAAATKERATKARLLADLAELHARRQAVAKQTKSEVEQPGPADQLAPGRVEVSAPPPEVTEVSPGRHLLQFMAGRSTQENLQYIQELLGPEFPSGDLAHMLDLALEALIEEQGS